MRLTSEHYLEACKERIEDARILHREGRYVFALYASGVAVETLLRAYAALGAAARFDARHDLEGWLRRCGFLAFLSPDERREAAAIVDVLRRRWRNAYRYADRGRVLADLKARGATRRVRGDQLKRASRVAFDAACTLHNQGIDRWPGSR